MDKIGLNMYSHDMLRLQSVDSFGKACGLLVAAEILDVPQLMAAIETSNCVNELLRGNILFCTSSPVALAQCIAQEAGADDSNNKIARYYFENKYNLLALWLGKTELDVALKLNQTISDLRTLVPSEQLEKLYGLYHIYLDSDVIIAEQYKKDVSHG